MNRFNALLLISMLLSAVTLSAYGQDSSITYQGRLQQSGEPFNGNANLRFRLYDSLNGGSQIGPNQTRNNTPVSDGLFQVELDFGATAFDGSDRFLEVRVNGTNLSPRQKVTATPYALIAASTAAGAVDGSAVDPSEVQLRVSGNCPAGESIRRINQNGSVVCEEDNVGEPGWNIGGNSGTDPATEFVGTTDATALEMRANNARGLRIEPSLAVFEGIPSTVNIVAGSRANQVLQGVRGATIAGGGAPAGDSDPDFSSEGPNRAVAHYSTVGGGYNNRAGREDGVLRNGRFSTISGGIQNVAEGTSSTVGGGNNNVSIGLSSTVAGGGQNLADATESTVGGGRENTSEGQQSTIGGGALNTAVEDLSTVSGGGGNTAGGTGSSVGGGTLHVANGNFSTVGGGTGNEASGEFSTVGGGSSNTAGAGGSTVAGGSSNAASGLWSAVGGGTQNTASGWRSTVSGGLANCAGGESSWAGGMAAKVRPGSDSGGVGSGCIDVPESGDADGDEGTFVWADSQGADFVSTGPDQFLVRAQGGVGFGRAPEDYFDVQAPFDFVAGDGSSQQGPFQVRLNTGTKFRVLRNGGVGVGSDFDTTGVPQNGLSVLGNIQMNTFAPAGNDALCRNAQNRISLCSSSARYKDDIQSLGLGLETVLALAPVAYLWTSNQQADIGFVAEDIAEIDERLVTRNSDGEIEGVRYGRLTAVLANAVQQINARERELDADLHAMSEVVQTINAENQQLRSRLAAVESQQASQLEALRLELALMRELLSARTAAVASNADSNFPDQGVIE